MIRLEAEVKTYVRGMSNEGIYTMVTVPRLEANASQGRRGARRDFNLVSPRHLPDEDIRHVVRASFNKFPMHEFRSELPDVGRGTTARATSISYDLRRASGIRTVADGAR